MRDNMDPALRAQIGHYVPIETRNFFCDRDALRAAHALHALLSLVGPRADARRAAPEPDPPRRPALQHLGQPRRGHGDRDGGVHAPCRPVRRLAARARNRLDHAGAARGARARLAATRMPTSSTSKQAKAFQVEWTPRGWMRPDLDLLGFEQQLYLRQPGYGTSYVTGKYLLDDLMRELAQQLGQGIHAVALLRRGERRRHDPGLDDPLAAHRQETRGRTMKKLLAAMALAADVRLAAAQADKTFDYDVLYAGKKRHADDGGRRRRPHARHLFVPRQRPRPGHRGGHLRSRRTARSRAIGRRARRPTARCSTSSSRFRDGRASWQSTSERGKCARRARDLPAELRQSRRPAPSIVRATQKAGGTLAGLPGGELQQREAGRTRVGPAGQRAQGRALRDLRHRPAAGLHLARDGRRHAPVRQHQRRRRPCRARRLRERAPELERLQQEAEADYLPRHRQAAHAGPARADPDPQRARRSTRRRRALGEPADVYVNGGRIAAIYPAGSPARHRQPSSRAAGARCCRACSTCTRTRTPGTPACRSRAASRPRATWATTTTTSRA